MLGGDAYEWLWYARDVVYGICRGLPGANVLPVVKIFDMAAGWLNGGSFDEIYGHCYLTGIKAVLNINIQSTLSVISLWLSRALLPWVPPFSCRVFKFEGCFPSSAGKPREVAIDDTWLYQMVFVRNDLTPVILVDKACTLNENLLNSSFLFQTTTSENITKAHGPHRSPEKTVQINKHIWLYHNVD